MHGGEDPGETGAERKGRPQEIVCCRAVDETGGLALKK